MRLNRKKNACTKHLSAERGSSKRMMTIIGNREYVQKKGIGGPCFKLYIQIHVLLPLSMSQMTTNWNSVFASPLALHLKLLLPFISFSV